MERLRLHGIDACVFDAYGTLFDVNGAARSLQDELGPRWQPLAELWRTKQLQYTWLRGLGGHHANFWTVTSDALSFACDTLKIDDPGLRDRLMTLYLSLDVYSDVIDALRRLKAGGKRLAILSNGTPRMLAAAAGNSGIADLLDAVLSVEEVGVFKPHPSVYRLASDGLQLAPDRICFLSSNGWDAYAAKAFGFHVIWCNRFNQSPERIPETPDGQIVTLAALPDIVLA
jgi:2-haloacid dehalogenase